MAGDRDDALLAEYNGSDLKITAILFLILTGFSVGLRTYVRGFMTNSFQGDDWLMLVAQANFVISCAFILIGVENYGLGHHNDVLPLWQEIGAVKYQALATASYITNMMFIKLSIGVFLLRLAVQKRYKWIIYISMAVVAIWSTALFFWDVFQCSPVAAQWDFTLPNYTCVSVQQVINAAYALSVLNIITDWLYALLPVPMIWKVEMSAQAKATVVAILGLGVFASVATLIRVKFLAQLEDTSDILFAGTNAMVWTLVEPGVAIVASSLVTIRPLLRQMRLKGFTDPSFHSGSRSRNRWGIRSVRSGGGLSGNNLSKNAGGGGGGGGSGGPGLRLNSEGRWSQIPSENGGDNDNDNNNLKMKDLEAGHNYYAGGGSKQHRTVGITLSQKEEEEQRQQRKEVARHNMLGVGTMTKDTDSISPPPALPTTTTTTMTMTSYQRPVGGHHHDIHAHTSSDSVDSSGESVLFIEGVKSMDDGAARTTTTTNNNYGTITTETKTKNAVEWRRRDHAHDLRPQSLEESEGIQGLTYPETVMMSSRARMVENNGSSNRFSTQGLPIQSN